MNNKGVGLSIRPALDFLRGVAPRYTLKRWMMLAKPWAKGAPTRSKAVNHFWYGDRSPWTERRLELSFDELQSQPPAKAVIMDRENPPQPRSARAVESEN